jgi:hypothetical protein
VFSKLRAEAPDIGPVKAIVLPFISKDALNMEGVVAALRTMGILKVVGVKPVPNLKVPPPCIKVMPDDPDKLPIVNTPP